MSCPQTTLPVLPCHRMVMLQEKKKQFTCVRSHAVPLDVTSDTQPGSKVSKQAFALYLVLAERGPKLQSLS